MAGNVKVRPRTQVALIVDEKKLESLRQVWMSDKPHPGHIVSALAVLLDSQVSATWNVTPIRITQQQ